MLAHHPRCIQQLVPAAASTTAEATCAILISLLYVERMRLGISLGCVAGSYQLSRVLLSAGGARQGGGAARAEQGVLALTCHLHPAPGAKLRCAACG